MNPKFPALTIIAMIMRIVGILIVLAGTYFLWNYFATTASLRSSIPAEIGLMGGISGIVVGLGMFAFGEIIGVLLAIEWNTWVTANRQTDTASSASSKAE